MKSFVFQLILCFLFGELLATFHCGQNWQVSSRNLGRAERNLQRKNVSERQSQGFDIIVNYANGVSIEFQNAFNIAVQVWEELLADTQLSQPIVIEFDEQSLQPGVLGATASNMFGLRYDAYRDAIEEHTGQTFPTEPFIRANVNLPNGVTLNPDFLIGINQASLKALGFSEDGIGTNSDGQIIFSTNFQFDTDQSDGISAGQTDFYAVAVHEIGHLLGFVSSVDSIALNTPPFQTTIGALDMFRFFSQDAFGTFTDSPRHMVPDGVDFHVLRNFDGAIIGNLSQAVVQQASHWRANESPQPTLGIMDPTLSSQEFLGTSLNDDFALFFIGYLPATNVQPLVLGARLDDPTTVVVNGFNFRNTTCDVQIGADTFTGLTATFGSQPDFAQIRLMLPQPAAGTPMVTCSNPERPSFNGQDNGNNNAASLLTFSFTLFVSLFLLNL